MVQEIARGEIAPLQEVQRRYAHQLTNPPTPEVAPKGEQVEPGIRLARCAKLMVLIKNKPEKALFFVAYPAH